MTGIERFVCKMYGKAPSDVNDARYKMYCASIGSMDSENVPPCGNALNLHTRRANYVSKIWKMSLEAKPAVHSPVGHGWVYEEGDLCIKWLTVGATPDKIFELMTCTCSRKCTGGKCCCIWNEVH